MFPSITAGQHISAATLWNRLKIFNIQPLPARNATLFDLTKKLDTDTLAALLGYSKKTITNHAAQAGITMGSYPAARQPPKHNSLSDSTQG